MHYIVTGGCGFIGSHLVDRLLAAGQQVTVVDDLSSGKRDNIPPEAAFIEADVTTPGLWDGLAKKADGVFHLAAVTSVQKSAEEWLATHRVNLGGIVALFDALARQRHAIPVVYASSAAVYGDLPQALLSEDLPCAPLSAYGADKLACEWQARIATQLHNIPTFGLRFFNVYGPRQDPSSPYSGVISIFAQRIPTKQKITIFGDGAQSRDFVYVSDIVETLERAMRALYTKPAHYVANACTGKHISITALAQTIGDTYGVRPSIEHAPARTGDIRHSTGNPALCASLLHFTPSVSLKDGLARLRDSA